MGFLVTRACRLAMQNITVLVPRNAVARQSWPRMLISGPIGWKLRRVGFRLAVRKALCHKDKLVESAQIRRFAFRPSFVIERYPAEALPVSCMVEPRMSTMRREPRT
jgi:hypothetical protein